jgi:hypothetical protein
MLGNYPYAPPSPEPLPLEAPPLPLPTPRLPPLPLPLPPPYIAFQHKYYYLYLKIIEEPAASFQDCSSSIASLDYSQSSIIPSGAASSIALSGDFKESKQIIFF